MDFVEVGVMEFGL